MQRYSKKGVMPKKTCFLCLYDANIPAFEPQCPVVGEFIKPPVGILPVMKNYSLPSSL